MPISPPCRWKWYAEALRIYEIQVKRRTVWYGIQAEQTVKYIRFAIELYGRLGLDNKIKTVLADLQKACEPGDDEMKATVVLQVRSIALWCGRHNLFNTAFPIIQWIWCYGRPILYLQQTLITLDDLEWMAGQTGRDDLADEYAAIRSAIQEQVASSSASTDEISSEGQNNQTQGPAQDESLEQGGTAEDKDIKISEGPASAELDGAVGLPTEEHSGEATSSSGPSVSSRTKWSLRRLVPHRKTKDKSPDLDCSNSYRGF